MAAARPAWRRRRPPHLSAYARRDSTSQRRRRAGSLEPAALVRDRRLVEDHRRHAAFAQPALQVDLLGVHEEPRVEAAHGAELPEREQQGRPDDPVDRGGQPAAP